MELATLLSDDVLLAVISVDAPTPRIAEATLNAPDGEPLRFASLNLALPGPTRGPDPGRELVSLLLIGTPDLDTSRVDTVVLPGESPRSLALPPPTATPGHVLDILRGGSAGRRDQILDFLMNEGWQRSASLRASSRAKRAFRSLLAGTARHAGVIEILATLRGAGTIIQGWARRLDDGVGHVVFESEHLSVEACRVATFDRDDVASDARGIVMLAGAWQDVEPGRIYRVYFRHEAGWFYLDVYDEVSILQGREALEHLRGVAPGLDGDEQTLTALSRMTRATYERRNTLGELGVPVRLEIDRALGIPGGVFVNGWLLDPRSLVRSVVLRSLSGFALRVDDRWVGRDRPDVTEAFVRDPGFEGLLDPAQHRHGVMLFAPLAQPAEAHEHFFLELELVDGAVAFIPVAMRHGASQADLREILGAFDVRDAAAGIQLEHHLAPFVRQVCSAGDGGEPTTVVETLGVPPSASDYTIVIPLTGPPAALDITLAQLAVHGDARGRQIVVVASRSGGQEVSAHLSRLADFYALSVTVLRSDRPVDRVHGLRLGAERASTRWVLALGMDVYAQAPGWMSGLSAAARGEPEASFISPTLLYEDASIRFAGRLPLTALARSEVLSERPPTVLRSRFEGYPREWIDSNGTERVSGATLACCLLRRDRLAQLLEPEPPYMNGDVKEAVLWQRAEAQGLVCVWVSGICMTALDGEGGGESLHWQTCAGIVDRWNLSADLGAGIAPPARRAGGDVGDLAS